MDTETKERILREAIKNIDNPWRNLTVKDVAQDLMMGENLANLLFKREDFTVKEVYTTTKRRKNGLLNIMNKIKKQGKKLGEQKY